MRPWLHTCVFCLLASLPLACTRDKAAPAAKSDPTTAAETPASIQIWKTITHVDPAGESIPDDVRKLVGKELAIVGFMIPNDASGVNEVHEFLLTPVAGGCIHVPPPPPNYIVHVTMERNKTTKIPYGAIEVRGRLLLPDHAQDRKMYALELHAYSVDEFDASSYMRY